MAPSVEGSEDGQKRSDSDLTAAGARITALNAINQDVPEMLKAAGEAIKLLSSQDSTSTESEIPVDRRAAFSAHAKTYFTLLKSIRDRLTEEAQYLEDAGLIQKEATKQADSMNSTTHGGLGQFDIAWLNARTKDVGAQKEAELLGEARQMLEKMQKSDVDAKMEDAGG